MKRLAWVTLLLIGCASEKPATVADAPAAAPPAPVAAAPQGPAYPATRAESIVDQIHGQAVSDPYRWLESDDAPEVKAWMKAQDGLTRAALAQLPGREAMEARLKQLSYIESVSAPLKRGGRFFYLRTHPDQEKGILYWKDGEKGTEKILLDPNTWNAGGAPVSLGVWSVSWDGKKVAFAQHPNHADEAILHVVDVDTGTWSKTDVIPGANYANPSWAPDNRHFYYEWLPTDPSIPASERPGYAETRLHELGADPAKDAIVHPKLGDATLALESGLSRDGKYLFVYHRHGWTSDDVYFQRVGKDKAFKPLVEKLPNHYDVAAWKDQLYIRTDEGAPRGRVFRASVATPDRKSWKEIVPEDPEAALQGFSIVGGQLALDYLHNAASELRMVGLDGKPVRTVAMPTIGTSSGAIGLADEDDAYLSFSSYITPRQVYRMSVKTGKLELWAKVEVPIEPDRFAVEQVWYPSRDGTRVSMFLVHRKDLPRDGSAPALLYGYGGFDVSITPYFRSSLFPWLEAGGLYAVANLRGGGEYGKAWHEAGMGVRKQNVFDDFIGAAEYLVREKYTSSPKLAITGGSNGGLLVGAAMVQRPELYGAVLCAVPLLDMVRFHLFGEGKTWTPEYGSPEDAEAFKAIYAYSPYHHVKPGAHYPPLLMLSADHDDRVAPLHARKFVAEVQAANPAGTAYLRIEANSGHQGADQVKQAIAQSVDQYAFLFHLFGMAAGTGAAPAASP